MGRELLNIKQHIALPLEVLYQMKYGHFRSVSHLVKHRLRCKQAAQRYPVGPPGQLFVLPYFDAVGMPELVQTFVGRTEWGRDPSCVRTVLRRAAARNDLRKSAVVGHLE